MFKKPKVNPVYVIEQELVKEKILIGKFHENGELETNEKFMFDILQIIYNRVLQDNKKRWMHYIVHKKKLK